MKWFDWFGEWTDRRARFLFWFVMVCAAAMILIILLDRKHNYIVIPTGDGTMVVIPQDRTE